MWIGGNRYLSETEAENNVLEMWNILGSKGWYAAPVAAVAGNFWQESTVNPNIWQNLDEGNTSLGYGLGQWTPMTKLVKWATDNGLDYTSGDTQCLMLIEDSGQWHSTGRPGPPSSSPPISWSEFWTSRLDVETLTKYFYWYWEDPSYSDPTLPTRLSHAASYYELITGHTPTPPPQPEPTGKMPFWFYLLNTMKRR